VLAQVTAGGAEARADVQNMSARGEAQLLSAVRNGAVTEVVHAVEAGGV
jgi:hypothetical protein